MKSGALVFLVAFMALAASWGGFVLAPQVQLSRSVQTNALGSSDLYPLGRPGLAVGGGQLQRDRRGRVGSVTRGAAAGGCRGQYRGQALTSYGSA